MSSNGLSLSVLGTISLMQILIAQGVHCDQYDEYFATTLPTLCPYLTFCTVGPHKQFKSKNTTPCCKPCSCNSDCLRIGNCCPDFPSAANSTSQKLLSTRCSMPVHYQYDEWNSDAYLKETASYFITSSCPLAYSDQDVVQKCTHPETLEIGDRVVVSDESGRLFYNRYCAQCNNVKKHTTWNLQLICRKYSSNLLNLHNLTNLNDNMCLLISSPPTGVNALHSRCYPQMYSECNITGQWQTFDPRVERACKNVNIPYMDENRHFSNVYSNPYCYLCNQPPGAIISRQCRPEPRIGRHDLMSSGFTAVIDLTSVSHRSGVDSTPVCQSSDVYDYHFGICRRLYCPVDLMPLGGKCIELFKATAGITTLVQINAIFADEDTQVLFNQTVRIHNIKKYFDAIATQLVTDIGIQAQSCGICEGQGLLRNDQSGISFLLQFKTSITCSATTIIDLVHKWALQKRRMSLNIGKQRWSFVVSIGYNEQEFVILNLAEKGYQMGAVFWHNAPICHSAFPLKPKFFCAHIDLPLVDYMEFVATQNGKGAVSDFTAVGSGKHLGNKNHTIYRICVDKYLTKKSSCRIIDSWPTVVYITMTISTIWLGKY